MTERESLSVAPPRPVVSYILNADAAGAFDRLDVSDAVRPFIHTLDLFVSPGDSVGPYIRGDRGIGIALLTLPDMPSALRLLAELPRHFAVRTRNNVNE